MIVTDTVMSSNLLEARRVARVFAGTHHPAKILWSFSVSSHGPASKLRDVAAKDGNSRVLGAFVAAQSQAITATAPGAHLHHRNALPSI